MPRLEGESFQIMSWAGGEDRLTPALSHSQEDSSLHWPEREQRVPTLAAQAGNQNGLCEGTPGQLARRALDTAPVLEVNKTISHILSTERAGICSLRAGCHWVETSRLTLGVLLFLLTTAHLPKKHAFLAQKDDAFGNKEWRLHQ